MKNDKFVCQTFNVTESAVGPPISGSLSDLLTYHLLPGDSRSFVLVESAHVTLAIRIKPMAHEH